MSKFRNFHEGEVALQRESRVDTVAFDQMVEHAFRPEMSDVEKRFIHSRTFAVAGSIDNDGQPWVSPLVGGEGELFSVSSDRDIVVSPRTAAADPLVDNVRSNGKLGVLFFEAARRRRSKSMGTAELLEDGRIAYSMQRHFGLCNKYIFKREHEVDDGWPARPLEQQTSTVNASLTSADREQLARADTVFVGSFHEGHGVDTTHRGGPPGFVSSPDETTLSMPDYVGNGMFQTLGNLQLDDRIGLLSIDVDSGRTIQITGRGSVIPSPPEDPYSQRTLQIAISAVRTHWLDVGRWRDIEPFELLPGLINPGTPYL